MLRYRLFLPALLLALLFGIPSRSSGQQGDVGFVQVVINHQFSIPYIETVHDDADDPFLHFNALMTALELPIDYHPGLGSALGFLPDGHTRFNLSLERETVLVGDTTHPLEPGSYLIKDQQLYVRYSVFALWLPLQIEWSVSSFQVLIKTGYVLPSHERKLMEGRRQALLDMRREDIDPAAIEQDVPWFDPGMFQFNATARTGSEGLDEGILNLRGVHRFLRGDLSYSLTANKRENSSRNSLDFLRLSYYDASRSWEVTLGDTYASFSPLVMSAVGFQGASFYTGGRYQRFGRTTLIGITVPGSDVDLYRLGVLVDFTVADEKGFYRFEDIPLSLTNTLFEIHVFTPEGRKLVEFRQISSTQEMVGAGQMATLGAIGEGEQVARRFSLKGGEVRYGLFPSLTLGGYILQLENFETRFDTIEAQNNAGLFFLYRPLGWLVLLVEGAQDSEADDSGSRLNAFFGFGDLTLELEQRRYGQDFSPPNRTRSSNFSEPDLADSIVSAQARTRFFSINLSLLTQKTDYGDSRAADENRLRMDRRLTHNLSSVLILTQDRFRESDCPFESGCPTTGGNGVEMLLTYRLGSLSRLEGSGNNRQELGGDSSTLYRVSWFKNPRIDSRWSYELSYTSNSTSESGDVMQGALGYLFQNGFRLGGRADSQEIWLVEAVYTRPFRLDANGLEALPNDSYNKAGVDGRVYVDENGNAQFDPGETLVPEVVILAPGVPLLESNAEGYYRGWGIPATKPVNIEVDLLTTDALYAPTQKRFPVDVRPGQLVRLNIPLVPSGGLDGLLNSAPPQRVSPGFGMDLVLAKADGTVQARTMVEWDGGFLFEGIPPGSYDLYPDPGQLESRGLAVRPERMKVEFPAGDEPAWIYDLNFRVTKQPVPRRQNEN